jgi:hypothetical protein
MLLMVLPSCTIEKKLGRDFLAQAPQFCIQLLPPQNIYKYNHKGETIPGFDSLTGPQQDSALYASSQFIRVVDDSTFLDKYVNSFIDQLREIGFRVFVGGDADTILQKEPQAYMINMSQLQLDEYLDPFEDSQQVGDTIFYKTFELNAVDASSWFELNKLNVYKPVKTVLYSSFTASDAFTGNFIMNNLTMNLKYRYKIDSLKVVDLYELASYSGRRNANYLFDYFMNQYIAYNMPKGMETLGYLHYLPSVKTFIFTDEEKLEVLPSK